MNLIKKLKYSLSHPLETCETLIDDHLFSLLLSEKQYAVRFNRKHYLRLDRDYIFMELRDYWGKYRYFDKIARLLGLSKPDFKDKKILDVGCGYTSVLNLLVSGDRTGIDIIMNALEKDGFELDSSIKWVEAPAEDIPFEDGDFDIVFCTDGIKDYADTGKAASEIKRVLKNNGILVLTNDIWTQEGLSQKKKQHHDRLTESDLLERFPEYEVLLNRRSDIKAQFHRFLKNRIITFGDEREIILVMRLIK